MNAVGPDQFVAITGRPRLIASTCGRPQPSPREGNTNASAAAYAEGNSVSGTRGNAYTRGDVFVVAPLSRLRASANASIRAATRSVPVAVSAAVSWYKSQRRNSATSSSAVNASRYALRSTSGALRASHLNTDRNFVDRTPPPRSGGPSTRLALASRSNSGDAATASASNRSMSTASGTTRSFSGRTPALANVSSPQRVGTHTSRMAFKRLTCSGSSRSVSNIVRPTATAAPAGGHRDVSYSAGCHAPGSEWHTTTACSAVGVEARRVASSASREEEGSPKTCSWSIASP